MPLEGIPTLFIMCHLVRMAPCLRAAVGTVSSVYGMWGQKEKVFSTPLKGIGMMFIVYLLVRMAQRWQVAVPTILYAYGMLRQPNSSRRLKDIHKMSIMFVLVLIVGCFPA